MEVTIVYSKVQLESAVQFIGNNNQFFLGKFDEVRESILRSMRDLTKKFPNGHWSGTMGYYVVADVSSIENMEEDENRVIYDILVDPGLGNDSFWSDGDGVEELFEFAPNAATPEELEEIL